jgi:hypothetical protein
MKNTTFFLIIFCSLMFACSTTPNEYFSRTSLNCNILFGFAGQGMEYELANPSVKLVDQQTMATEPMTRAEVLNSKVETVETNFEKVKSLSVTNETKEMIDATIALYDFVLPVYKNEYKQLAALYDDKANAEAIAAMEKTIRAKYAEKFEALYHAVQTAGFVYALKHGIKVQTVNPVPGS